MRLIVLAFACLLASDQDPQKRVPTSRPALPPIQEPFRSKVERKDLLQEFSKPTPLEGFYRLRAVVKGGAELATTRGYVYFGRSHMALNTRTVTHPRVAPFVQASVRSYRVEGDQLITTSLLGHDYPGKLRIEQSGLVEQRRFQRAGTLLRIYQADRAYMEFERVE